MIKQKQLILSSNFATHRVLKEKGIDSFLWEDCYDKDDLLRLYRDFKIFCNEWYTDERGKDYSLYDGMSIGSAISIFLAYDLETWIRVFYLFEYLASNKIDTKFYVLNKDYFPPEVFEFIDNVNKVYDSSIIIISLDLTDCGIEQSVNQIVGVQRSYTKLKKADNARSIRLLDNVKDTFSNTRREKNRCLVINIRNSDEYLGSFIANRQKTPNLRLFFDTHYFVSRRMFANDLLINKISFICDDPYNIKIGESFIKEYTNQLLQCVKNSLQDIEFLAVEGKKIFCRILCNYLKKTLQEQIIRYLYLSRTIKKHQINTTLCDGPDLPETYYCKHIMDKQGGVSFYMPHGLMVGRRSRELDRGRELIAHYYFYYTESEKNIFAKTYNIAPERFFPIRFLKKHNSQKRVSNNVSEYKILILLDNFQICLSSRINYFKSFTDLYEVLKDLSIANITVRLHGAFYNSYSFPNVTEEDKEKFFFSLPIQNKSKIPLKDIIKDFDIVIGPLTSCILEAMWPKVFFIPFIPDYFPARTLKEIIKIQWFPELYPKPCQSIDQLKDTLSALIQSPEMEYNKYLKSIRKVGNSETSYNFLWQTIATNT